MQKKTIWRSGTARQLDFKEGQGKGREERYLVSATPRPSLIEISGYAITQMPAGLNV